MKFIKLPVLFLEVTSEEIETAEKLGIDIDKEVQVDFMYVSIIEIENFNVSESGTETTLHLKSGHSSRVQLPIEKFIELLDENGCTFPNN